MVNRISNKMAHIYRLIISITLILCIGLLGNSSEAIAQKTPTSVSGYSWENLSSNVPGVNTILTNIQVIGQKLWITTQSAGIYYSQDGGITIINSPAYPTFGIFMKPDSKTGYAVGGSKVYRTTDGGIAWSETNLRANLRDVHFANNNIGYVAGNVVYRTSNGGNSWDSKTMVANYVNIYSIFFPDPNNPNTGYAAVAYKDPALYKTVNGGDSWEAVDLGGLTGGLNSLEFTSPNNGWVAGNAGKIYHYDGNEWTPQSSGVVDGLLAVSFAPNGLHGCAVGNMSVIVCTYDGGKHWVREEVDFVNAALTGVDVLAGGIVYIAGYGGTLIKGTTDYAYHEIYIPLINR